MPFPELKNPPIVESIIILRFKDEVDEKFIEEFCNSSFIKNEYGVKGSATKAGNNHSARKYGYTLKTPASDKILRVDLDSLSFHRLSYVPFDEFFDEFDRTVEAFLSIHKSFFTEQNLLIDLITLRYINLIKVKSDDTGVFNSAHYITLYVQSPLVLNNYFLQVDVTNKEDGEIQGIVVQTLKPNADGVELEGIVLDIQVYRALETYYDKSKIRECFWGLREYKNFLFFEMIHPEVIKTYQ